MLFACCVLAHASKPSVQAAQASRDSTPVSVAPAPPAGTAQIFVYREHRIGGSAGFDRIFVNGSYLVTLHIGEYASREVPQGTVIFSAMPRAYLVPGALLMMGITDMQKKKYERLRIEVEPGKTYYVKWSIGSKMKLVDAATGAKEMAKLHLSKSAKEQEEEGPAEK